MKIWYGWKCKNTNKKRGKKKHLESCCLMWCYIRGAFNHKLHFQPLHTQSIFSGFIPKGLKAGFFLCSWSKAWQNTTSTPVFLFRGVYRIWNCRQVLRSPEIFVCVSMFAIKESTLKCLHCTYKSEVMCSSEFTISTPISAVTGGSSCPACAKSCCILKRGWAKSLGPDLFLCPVCVCVRAWLGSYCCIGDGLMSHRVL